MTVDQFQRWVQGKYGRALTDAELKRLADAVGHRSLRGRHES